MDTRLAVLVGIDGYAEKPLKGCVKDVGRLAQALQRHHDGSPNFVCRTCTSSETGPKVTRALLRQQFEQLFDRQSDMVLFYFAGHGSLDRHRGAIMVTQDTAPFDKGVPLNDLLAPLAASPAKAKIVIIDACYSGGFGQTPFLGEHSVLADNVAVLAATRKLETAAETESGGLFTNLVVAALEGGASDVRGAVSIADIYTYASSILSGWQQRPLFKSSLAEMAAVRKCEAAVTDSTLRRLMGFFEKPGSELALDPSFEESSPQPISANVEIFRGLQKLRDARLLVPCGAPALYWAAMRSKSCGLTPLGRFYWELVRAGNI